MGYALDLDEHDEHRLEQELQQRRIDRRSGLCDYCHREPTTPSCKFPHRHDDPRVRRSDLVQVLEHPHQGACALLKDEHREIVADLALKATAAGLGGHLVIWADGNGRPRIDTDLIRSDRSTWSSGRGASPGSVQETIDRYRTEVRT